MSSSCINDGLLALCNDSDESLSHVYNRIREFLPDFLMRDFFTCPKTYFSEIKASLELHNLSYNQRFVYNLLSLHFKRRRLPNKAQKYGRFVGTLSNSKKDAVYFPREHLISFLSGLFHCPNIDRRYVENIWAKLHKNYLSCRSS